jgi:hypothetical protein
MKHNNLESIEEIQDLTYELMSAFHSGLSWIIVYCEKNNLPIPDLDKAKSLISMSGSILENSELEQPLGNTYKTIEDETEP